MIERWKRIVAFAVALAFLAMPGSAFAGSSNDDRALELKARGDVAMESDHFSDALNDYRASYDLSPQPALLYNMGSAEQRLGQNTEALRHLEQFSRTAPPDLKMKVPHLDSLLDEVRSHVALLTVRTNVPNARVTLRGKYLGASPMKSAVATSGGRAEIEIAADGYVTYQREVTLEEGRSTVVDVSLLEKGASSYTMARFSDAKYADTKSSSDSSSSAITKKWWFWTGVGVVVVGGVVITAALLTEKSAPRGDIGPGQATAPLLRF
ncbi:MAG: PEGA domain-containing protein [Polyangiaceae bacterium]